MKKRKIPLFRGYLTRTERKNLKLIFDSRSQDWNSWLPVKIKINRKQYNIYSFGKYSDLYGVIITETQGENVKEHEVILKR